MNKACQLNANVAGLDTNSMLWQYLTTLAMTNKRVLQNQLLGGRVNLV